MKAFGTRMRGGIATLLSAALIVSGALLAAPAASAEEPVAAAPVVETVATEAPALEAPAAEAPAGDAAGSQPEATAESPAAPEADLSAVVVQSSAAETASVPGLAAAVAPAVAPAQALQLTVSKTTGLDSAGETVSVSGTGYNPAQPIYVFYCADTALPADLWTLALGCQTGAKQINAATSSRSPKFNTDGSFTVDLPIRQLNGAATSVYTAANHTGMTDRTQDAKVALSFAAQGTATVTAASEAGLTVTASLTGVTPASQPAGVHVGVVLRGTADGAVEADFVGATASVKTIPASAEFSAEVVIPAAKLDRTKQYELVVWPRRTNPVASNIVKVIPFDVAAEQWGKVFPAPTGPSIVGTVTGASADGLTLSVQLDNVTIPAGKFGAYVGVIEKDRVAEYGRDAGAGMVEHYFPTKSFVDGSATAVLNVPKDKKDSKQQVIRSLDASKQYVVVSWFAHGYLTDASKLAQSDVSVSPEQWASVFPTAARVTATSSVTDAGLNVNVNATSLPGKIYAALIERGTAADIDMSKSDSYAAFAMPFPTVTDGAASFSLTAPMTKLDRKKQYEVLVWKQHSLPTSDNVYGQADVEVTSKQWDELQGIKPPVVVPPTKPQPTAPGAGSLTWGVSSSFANYVTGTIAKGSISTSGVGGGRGGYVFPQATGSSWNAETRTGTVRYSGTVTFTGHSGLLSETFANPVITVSSPASGTISAGGQSFSLNLASAGFAVNSDGSVTWSGVSVGGGISGGDGAGAGGSLGMDSLSFTVGSASGMSFGSTSTVSPFAKARTAAEKAPASTGLTVVTPGAKLVPGGEIEITASGFQPNEQGILVVMYSEPTVLDTNAKADKNGVVRWIGTLPKDLAGKHTITLQGSINVGQEITIAKAAEVKKKATTAVAAETTAPVVQAAEGSDASGLPSWVWWTGALALLVIAGTGTALVVAQRRRVDAPTHL